MSRPTPKAVPMDCPFCGLPMLLRAGKFGPFYACVGYPRCQTTCLAHPDGTPGSTPADPATKRARVAAHDAFDRLWKSGWMTRNGAYRHLQRLMGLPEEQAHIGRFDKARCEALIALLADPANQPGGHRHSPTPRKEAASGPHPRV